MKRFIVGISVAVAMLIAATSAFAALGNYSGGYGFHGKSGSKSKPAPLSFSQHFTITPTTPGALTGILTEVKTTISGVKVDAKGFPTCTAAKINGLRNTKFDGICPKGALVATGSIQSQLGTAQNYAPQGEPCNPLADVWNAGPGKLTFFFKTSASHSCANGDVVTGAAPAFTATYHQSGDKTVVDIPIPSAVTNPGHGSYYVAVTGETLNWKYKSHGSTKDITSIGCKGKRHYSYSFSAHNLSGSTDNKTVSGTAACG